MIVVKRAPAGYIGQVFSDHDEKDPVARTMSFLDVTGKWCDTETEAIASCRQALEHKRKLARARVAREQQRLQLLELDHNDIRRE